MQNSGEIKTVATNRKAYHDYFIDEKYECGIELKGSEVKSIREGKVSIKESFGRIENGELWLYDMYIAPYERASFFVPEARRKRRLLMKKAEIKRLTGKLKEKGYTLIPLSVYFKGPYVKIELGLARGKKKYDKRREIAEKEANRRLRQALKIKQRSQ